MSAGRPMKPVELHVLHGNPSELTPKEIAERTSSGLEPMTDFTPPAHLDNFQKKVWRELCAKFGAVKILSIMDGLALELLIDSYAEWVEHRDYLNKNGYTIIEEKTVGGETEKADPRCALKHNAHKRCVELLTQFGWTPVSRNKLKSFGSEADPLFGGMSKRPKK